MHNLNLMTLEELNALHATTSALVAAGKALVAHKIDPVFSLEPGLPARITLIRQAVSGEQAAESQPAYVLGERLKEFMERCLDVQSDTALPVYVPKFGPMSEGAKPETEVAETPEPEAAPSPAAPDSKAEPAPEAPSAPVAAPPKLRAGPLDDDERAMITRLAAEGVARPVIAAQLGRRVQSVSLYLSSLEQAKSKIEAKPREAQKAAPPSPAKVSAPLKTAHFDEHKAELDHLDQQERAAAKITISTSPPVKAADKTAASIPKPAARPAPKITSAAPAPAAGVERPKPALHDPIAQHLDQLGFSGPWSAGLDLELVDGLSKGLKLDMMAADFGLDTAALKARFMALTRVMRDERGMMTLDDQKRLLTVLRSRAPAKGSAA